MYSGQVMNPQQVVAEEIRRGYFDWKIERFHDTTSLPKKSSLFKVGKLQCCLQIFGRNPLCAHCSSWSHVYLKSVNDIALPEKTEYKLSIVSPDKEFLLISRLPQKCLDLIPLTVVEDYLIDRNVDDLLPNGTLTLRIYWCILDAQKINILSSMQTIGTLSRDLTHFYENKTDTDCVLRVGERCFPAHRLVLSARSTVFAAMFRHDTSENRSGVVDITDVDGDVLGNILHYVYSGQIHGLTPNNVVATYDAADKYAFIELRDICLHYLKGHLTVQNVCDAAVLSDNHGEMGLKIKIVMFIEQHFEELQGKDEWKNFSKDKSTLAITLLSSILMDSKRKKSSVPNN